jgi:hypothetical protein
VIVIPRSDDSPNTDDRLRASSLSSEDRSDFVILCRLPVVEAELAKAKLESEGIPAVLRDTSMAVMHPLIVSEVPVLVQEPDVARARNVLAQPAGESAEGDYVEEAWRCPRCHRRTVDLQPPSKVRRVGRAICVLLIVMPFILPFVRWIIGDRQINRAIDRMAEIALIPWMLGIITLTLILLLSRRGKRCRECGYEWTSSSSGSE